MKKLIENICEGCDSEFALTFNEALVSDHDKMYCPFCGFKFESVEEEVEEYDPDFEPDWE